MRGEPAALQQSIIQGESYILISHTGPPAAHPLTRPFAARRRYCPIAYPLVIFILAAGLLGVGSLFTIALFWGNFWRSFW